MPEIGLQVSGTRLKGVHAAINSREADSENLGPYIQWSPRREIEIHEPQATSHTCIRYASRGLLGGRTGATWAPLLADENSGCPQGCTRLLGVYAIPIKVRNTVGPR